jgi:hypothetical protein
MTDTTTTTEPTGLVDDKGQTVTVEQAIASTEPPKEEPKYPEWLPEKFKTGEDWQEKLGQSYTELEKVLKEKGKVAPDAYEVDEAIKSKIEPENLQAFNTLMKDAKLSQDQYKVVLTYAHESGLLDVPDYEGEMAKLGDQKDVIIGALTTYAEKNLTPELQEAMSGMVYTAEQAKVLYDLILKTDRTIPARAGDSTPTGKADVQKQLEAIIENPKTRYDTTLQKEAEALAKRLSAMS